MKDKNSKTKIDSPKIINGRIIPIPGAVLKPIIIKETKEEKK